jgi:hypothetical protein
MLDVPIPSHYPLLKISKSRALTLIFLGRPRYFLKVMWGAQFFIYTVYLVYGCFIYHFQGQYSFQPAYMGMSNYGMSPIRA